MSAAKTLEKQNGRVLRLSLNEKERGRIVFGECRDCSVDISFKFTTGKELTVERETWAQQPKSERPMQQIIFDKCVGMKVLEHTSVDSIIVFNECSGCTLVSESCDQALDLYSCADMELKAPLVKQIRIIKCRNVVVACSNECDIVSLHNVTEPAVTRPFHVPKTATAVVAAKIGRPSLRLEGIQNANGQRYA